MNDARRIIDGLIAIEPIKTWSLIVTIIGERGGPGFLTGKELNQLLATIGIKPEATRVALHRLKKDGWLDTTKSGREVTYNLSEKGRLESERAYKDVYRKDVKYSDGWVLVLEEGDDEKVRLTKPVIKVSKNTLLIPREHLNFYPNAMPLAFTPESAPAWFREKIVRKETLRAAEQLLDLAQNAQSSLKTGGAVSTKAVHILILHRWRKLALRDASWAYISLYEKSALARCHRLVTSLFPILVHDKLNLLKK